MSTDKDKLNYCRMSKNINYKLKINKSLRVSKNNSIKLN